jgi:hypothetical protein
LVPDGQHSCQTLETLCAFYFLTRAHHPVLQQSSSHFDTSIRVIRDTELYAARLNARGVRGALRGDRNRLASTWHIEFRCTPNGVIINFRFCAYCSLWCCVSQSGENLAGQRSCLPFREIRWGNLGDRAESRVVREHKCGQFLNRRWQEYVCHMGQLQQMCRTQHGVCSDDLDVLISKVYASC